MWSPWHRAAPLLGEQGSAGGTPAHGQQPTGGTIAKNSTILA